MSVCKHLIVRDEQLYIKCSRCNAEFYTHMGTNKTQKELNETDWNRVYDKIVAMSNVHQLTYTSRKELMCKQCFFTYRA